MASDIDRLTNFYLGHFIVEKPHARIYEGKSRMAELLGRYHIGPNGVAFKD